jgi:predicted nucleic acid-binding protein
MAAISAIVDTGFVVGALDAADQWHAWVECGGLMVCPVLPAEVHSVDRMFDRYGERMDYADACLVRLSELHREHTIVTTDAKDFRVYRRFRREPLPLLTP